MKISAMDSCLNTCSPVSGTVWEEPRGVALLDKMSLGVELQVSKVLARHSLSSLSVCLCLCLSLLPVNQDALAPCMSASVHDDNGLTSKTVSKVSVKCFLL